MSDVKTRLVKIAELIEKIHVALRTSPAMRQRMKSYYRGHKTKLRRIRKVFWRKFKTRTSRRGGISRKWRHVY